MIGCSRRIPSTDAVTAVGEEFPADAVTAVGEKFTADLVSVLGENLYGISFKGRRVSSGGEKLKIC